MASNHPIPSAPPERYEQVSVGEGQIVIFDLENHHAWVQSEVYVELDDYR